MLRRTAGLAGIIAIAGSMLGSAWARPLPTPAGMLAFCTAYPAECVLGRAEMVNATSELADLLQTVNRQVNGAIAYSSDPNDVWTLNPDRGDCEDYALSKRSALIALGVDPGALRLAFTFTERGAPHAILVVRTSAGDFVLDNVNNNVITVKKSEYRLLAMSSKSLLSWNY